MPLARVSDRIPGLALAFLFALFAIVGNQSAIADPATVWWRIAAGVVSLVCVYGCFRLTDFRARIAAGSASVSWIMLWAVYVVWRDPSAVDIMFKGLILTLAVLATWYWSHHPAPVVLSDRYTHSARATGMVHNSPPRPYVTPRYNSKTWMDFAHPRVVADKEALEAEG